MDRLMDAVFTTAGLLFAVSGFFCLIFIVGYSLEKCYRFLCKMLKYLREPTLSTLEKEMTKKLGISQELYCIHRKKCEQPRRTPNTLKNLLWYKWYSFKRWFIFKLKIKR